MRIKVEHSNIKSLYNTLDEEKCICFLKDGRTVHGCQSKAGGWIHPYILYNVAYDIDDNIANAILNPEMWLWAYKYVPATRLYLEDIVAVINYAEVSSDEERDANNSYFSSISRYDKEWYKHLPKSWKIISDDVIPWTETTLEQFEDDLDKANDTLNQAILRGRIGGLHFSTNSEDLYIRVSSVYYDWTDIIYEYLYKHPELTGDIIITRDHQADAFSDGKDIPIDTMTIEEFKSSAKNHLVESIDKKTDISAIQAYYIKGLQEGAEPTHNPVYCIYYKKMLKEANRNGWM